MKGTIALALLLMLALSGCAGETPSETAPPATADASAIDAVEADAVPVALTLREPEGEARDIANAAGVRACVIEYECARELDSIVPTVWRLTDGGWVKTAMQFVLDHGIGASGSLTLAVDSLPGRVGIQLSSGGALVINGEPVEGSNSFNFIADFDALTGQHVPIAAQTYVKDGVDAGETVTLGLSAEQFCAPETIDAEKVDAYVLTLQFNSRDILG